MDPLTRSSLRKDEQDSTLYNVDQVAT